MSLIADTPWSLTFSSGYAQTLSLLRSDLQIQVSILFVILEILVIKFCLLYVAQCCKDTTWIMIAQRFEIITKSYES